MAHWRDGGIGTVPGSDDRPIEEWTLLEKLAEIASTQLGAAMPLCLGRETSWDWATPLKIIAQAAFDEIVRLRGEPDPPPSIPARIHALRVSIEGEPGGIPDYVNDIEWLMRYLVRLRSEVARLDAWIEAERQKQNYN